MSTDRNVVTRRDFVLASAAALMTARQALSAKIVPPPAPAAVSGDDRRFLEDYAKRCFRYFWEQTNDRTGLTLDRARMDGTPSGNNVASTAATGFALTSLCIAAERGWIAKPLARARALTSLRWLWSHAFHDHGWYFHFMDASTGQRRLNSEISSIDTALLIAGVLTVSEYFPDREVRHLATQIFDRIDFAWMLNGDPYLLSHGVQPGSGFIPSRWSAYSEASILYLMAIGASRHGIPPQSWYMWLRPEVRYQTSDQVWTYISGGPLFTHQYSHAWIDFRHQIDGDPYGTNFFQNSVIATYAHRDFCISLQSRYSDYGPNMWGITVSDSQNGYVAWGGPPSAGPINGTLVPCAVAGSVMFTPEICIPVLRAMEAAYGDKVYQRYGFTDAFNPNWKDKKLWVNHDVIGIDIGISLLSVENVLTGNVWRWFMRNQYIQTGMERAGFRLSTPGSIIHQTPATRRT
ncbi:MAG TPA: glucoamylase family protein [Bryobacteraceae bacterium]|nr:glucoamylase family protein [Bryobacteraceae bacterium]